MLPNASLLLTPAFLRARADYRATFVRRNTVPADINGHLFAEYEYKFAEMVRGLDESGVADVDVAHLAYETWMR